MTIPTHHAVSRPERPLRYGLRSALRASGVEAPVRLLLSLAIDLTSRAGAVLDLAVPRKRRPARRAARTTARVRRWARLAGELKGAYAKAGQFVALRYDVLPHEARAALDALQDRVPPLPFSVIRHRVESELGATLEDHFGSFAPEPLGAASIAQVHRATLLDGTPVAVKVMYPWLESALPRDLALLRRGLQWLLPGAEDFDRLFEEFADGVRSETDFEQEAVAAEQIAANLASHTAVVVPRVYRSHSTRRVLTMSLHGGLRIDDRAALLDRGVDPARIVEILARAYAQQVFEDGLFHADPHPGNLFVLDDAGTEPRVLFVDFGLCKRLAPELRQAIREAIYALLQKQPAAFVDRMEDLGMLAPGSRPEVEHRVRAMFDRITRGGGALSLSGSEVLGIKDEAKQLLATTTGLQLPNDLLLYAKTLSYLFALCERLEPEVDVMRISVPYLLKFLAAREVTSPTAAAPASG